MMIAVMIVVRKMNEIISHQYNIGHATLELECVGCEPDLLYCDIVESSQHEHAH